MTPIRDLLSAAQADKPQFGDFCDIEQKRYGVPNEMFVHKVINVFESNAYVDVPVQSNATETLHDECVPVVSCICCGIDETEVRRYRLSDVKIRPRPLSAKPAQQPVDARLLTKDAQS